MEKSVMDSGESKNLEYKVSVPRNSEKYMKTVIAYANGQGGRIIFGFVKISPQLQKTLHVFVKR